MKKMTVVVLAVLVVVGVTACSPNDPVLPVPATSVEQATEDASTSMSMSFTRTRIYESLHEVAEDCTIVIVGTAAGKQRLQEDYPGPLTLTEITVTEVLKGSAEVGSTITLGDLGTPTDSEDQVWIEGGSGPVAPSGTYLLHLRPLGEYGGPDGELIDGNWILVSPFFSHYQLQGDDFVLMADSIDDALPHSIPRDEVANTVVDPG
jgi:hypothetical protein